jgi:2'-5' RNA ligase
MLFVLCYPGLPTEAAERIEAFRRRHEPARAALVREHVTLVFGLRSVPAEALIRQAAEAAAAVAPFEAVLTRPEPHEDPVQGGHKLFLMVEDGGILAALHRRFYEGPQASELRHDIAFQPHVTIAEAASAAALQPAIGEAATLPLPTPARMPGLSVAELGPGGLRELAFCRFAAAETQAGGARP